MDKFNKSMKDNNISTVFDQIKVGNKENKLKGQAP